MLVVGFLVLGAFADCQCGPSAGQCSCSDSQCAPGHRCTCICNWPSANICGCEGSGNTTEKMQKRALADPCSSLAGSYSGELLADAPTPSGHCKLFQEATVQGDQAILITSHCTKCHCDGSGSCDCSHSPWLITGTCNKGLINAQDDKGRSCQLAGGHK